MTKEENFKLLKIQTCVLKVNIHCDGCKQKVKKILQRIEGVYQVIIDSENQKVTVSGSLDSATLIKKLARAGKHAELWSQKSNQIQHQKQQNNCIKGDKNNKSQKQGLIKDLESFKNQPKFPAFSPEEDDECFDDDEEEEDDEENELQFLRERVRQQQAIDANNAKKNVAAAIAAANNGRMQNNIGNGNAGKKENPNPNMGNPNPNMGIPNQKTTMGAMKMNNAHLGGGNDISTMMGLAGFHGNIANSHGLGGFQAQPNNMINGYQNQGSSSSAGLPNGGYPASMMRNMHPGYQNSNNPSSMMMMQNRQQQLPQMVYNRSPLIPTSTGYFYNNYSPAPSYYSQQPNYSGDYQYGGTHMFNDENTGCSIM